MTRSLAFISAVIVAIALALPQTIEAQASRRGGSSSGGSSSGSGSEGGGVAVPRAAPPAPRPAPSGGEARPARPAGEDTSNRRPAAVRPPRSPSPPVQGTTLTDDERSAGTRARTTQAPRGVAQPRTSVQNPQHPFSPWGRWYPWYYYSPSYGYYGYGRVVYSPWLFGGTLWTWDRYGWHAPYLYDPYGYLGYAPYYWSPSDTARDVDTVPTGSLRLRVDPGHARVYVDGALAGVAQEFGGLSDHLRLPAGVHQIELRADGYEPRAVEVEVKAGRTRTERVKLTKE